MAALVGEVGVGKSWLTYEFTHSHRMQDWLILEASSVSYGKATSYLPVIDLLKGELVDVGRIDSDQAMRWSYVILLRETSGVGITFERLESTVLGAFRTGGAPDSRPYRRRLPPHGEIRLATAHDQRHRRGARLDRDDRQLVRTD